MYDLKHTSVRDHASDICTELCWIMFRTKTCTERKVYSFRGVYSFDSHLVTPLTPYNTLRKTLALLSITPLENSCKLPWLPFGTLYNSPVCYWITPQKTLKFLFTPPRNILLNSHLHGLFPLVIPPRLGYSPQLFSRILDIALPFLSIIPIYSSELIYHAMLLLLIMPENSHRSAPNANDVWNSIFITMKEHGKNKSRGLSRRAAGTAKLRT